MLKNKSDKIVVLFIVKSLASTVASLLLFSFLASSIIYKLDLNLESARLFSVFIMLLSSVTVSFVSVLGLKNSGALMGLLSVLPLVLYSFFNLIFGDNTIVLFLIKIITVTLCAALTGLIVTKKAKRYKV